MSIIGNQPNTGGSGVPFLSGSALNYSALPETSPGVIDSAYAGQIWLTDEGEGLKFPFVGDNAYKYPSTTYTPNSTLTAWKQTPFKVQMSEDTTSMLNILDWNNYAGWVININIGSIVLSNSIFYQNITGLWTTTDPSLDTANWILYSGYTDPVFLDWVRTETDLILTKGYEWIDVFPDATNRVITLPDTSILGDKSRIDIYNQTDREYIVLVKDHLGNTLIEINPVVSYSFFFNSTDPSSGLWEIVQTSGTAIAVLPVVPYGDLNHIAWNTVPTATYLMRGLNSDFSNYPTSWVLVPSPYTININLVNKAPDEWLQAITLSSSADFSNKDIGRPCRRIGITFGSAVAVGWKCVVLQDDEYIDILPTTTQDWKAGRTWFDSVSKSHMMDTGYTDVTVDVGRENHIEVFNNTASPILNGAPVSLAGTFTGILPDVIPTNASITFTTLAFTGVATMDIPAGESGLTTSFGLVKGVNTQSLIQGFIYADSAGWYTQTRPIYPESRLIVGGVVKTGVTDGILSVGARNLVRSNLKKSYSFTSQGIGAGLYYKGGFYEWATTDITLTQANLTQTFGNLGRSVGAHAGIVPSGTGIVVGGGQVGLRVTGIQDSSTGIQVAGQIGIVTEDITTLTIDVMAETSEKFSGVITYELYIVSGAPTSYSLTFNYGFSKYEDLGNQQFSLTGLECVWQGNAPDSNFDIALKHHKPEGWTYAATGFLAGNGDIARRSVDQQLAIDVDNNLSGAWKRTLLDTFINGASLGGIIFEIITGANNTIQTMDLHIDAVSEEL